MTTPPQVRAYAFGPFLLDRVKRLVTRDGQPLPLTAKSFDLLVFLIERRDRTVSKDEVLATVWNDRMVEENNLFRHVSRVRKALDERPDEHRYVVTVPGVGYRFVGDVTELDRIQEAQPAAVADGVAQSAVVQPEATIEPPGDTLPIGSSAGDAGHPSRSWVPFAALAALVAVVALALGLQRTGPADLTTSEGLQQITYDAGFPREPAWSPNGQAIAYTSDRAGNPDIWVLDLRTHELSQVTSSVDAESSPSWSPDGQWIAFRSERDAGGIFIAAPHGGPARQLAAFGFEPRWSPDGSQMLFSSSTVGVGGRVSYVVDAAGGAAQQVRPDLTGQVSLSAAAWHPDGRITLLGWESGRQVLITTGIGARDPSSVMRSDEFHQRLEQLDLTLGAFQWDRSGARLFFEGRAQGIDNIWLLTIDPATMDVLAGPRRLTAGTGADIDMALSPDGSRMAFAIQAATTRLWSYPFDPQAGRVLGEGRPMTSGIPGELAADATLDGRKLVYRAVRGQYQEVWEHQFAAGGDRLLFSGTGGVFTKPHWSADGRQVAFSKRSPLANQPGTSAELILLTTASRETRVVPVLDQVRFSPSDWAADGRTILGACQPSPQEPVGLCDVSITDGPMVATGVRLLTSAPNFELWNGRFSPDQRWILFQALNRAGHATSDIYAMRATGGEWTRVSETGPFNDKPHWSPDGRTIYYVSTRDGAMNVWGRHFDSSSGQFTGAAFRVTSFQSPTRRVSPNLRDMEIAISRNQLILPITHSSSQLWTLDIVDR